MKHLRNFPENNFNELLVDPMNFGIDDIKPNAVYLDKGGDDYWGEDEGFYEGSKEYILYFGPCDRENGLSDSISFTDEFIRSVFGACGAYRYDLHSAENSHSLYFDSNEIADDFYDELLDILKSYGFEIISD